MYQFIFVVTLLMTVTVAGLAQKGKITIAAGPLLSLPLGLETHFGVSQLNTGLGVETVGEYNLSERGALQLKVILASWGYQRNSQNLYPDKSLTLAIIHAGYRHQFGSSGFFINALAGVDVELPDVFVSSSFSLGTGKRFPLKNGRFIDAGVDFIGADAESLINLSVLFSLFHINTSKKDLEVVRF